MGRVVKLTAVLFLLAKSIEPETSHGDKVTLSVKKVLKCFRGKNFIWNKYIKENTSKALYLYIIVSLNLVNMSENRECNCNRSRSL